jgi:hypothetical protein
MKATSIIFLFLLNSYLMAQTTVTIGSGNWTFGPNWSSGVPSPTRNAIVNDPLTLNTDLTLRNSAVYTFNDAVTDPPGGPDRDIVIRDDARLIINATSIIGGDIEIRNDGRLTINASSTFGGDIEIRNDAELEINTGDTLRIEGDLELAQDATLDMEEGSVLIIEGDLEMRNSSTSIVDGQISVLGEVEVRNSSTITGTGNLEAGDEVEIRNSSTIFGSSSDCGGPCEYGSGQGLPVELTYFDAKIVNSGTVKVQWETETEINNDYFIIELAYQDGQFNQVAQVAGNGNSNRVIRYNKVIPVENFRFPIYLRLTQIDYDGKSETFSPIFLSKEEFNSKVNVTIYPNPNRGNQLFVELQNLKAKEYNIDLLDARGQRVKTQRMNIQESDFYNEFEILKGTQLSPGIYYLRISCNENRLVKKVIVQ